MGALCCRHGGWQSQPLPGHREGRVPGPPPRHPRARDGSLEKLLLPVCPEQQSRVSSGPTERAGQAAWTETRSSGTLLQAGFSGRRCCVWNTGVIRQPHLGEEGAGADLSQAEDK